MKQVPEKKSMTLLQNAYYEMIFASTVSSGTVSKWVPWRNPFQVLPLREGSECLAFNGLFNSLNQPVFSPLGLWWDLGRAGLCRRVLLLEFLAFSVPWHNPCSPDVENRKSPAGLEDP